MQLRGSECSLTLNGNIIKGWQWGIQGPKVLLVHGWNGRGLQLNRFIDPLLNAGYQVVCFDAPAHGQTSGQATHLLEISDVIQTICEQQGPFHAAIAHSFGVACLSAAIHNGASIPTIISISSPGGLSKLIQRYCAYMKIPNCAEQRLLERLERRVGKTLWKTFADNYPLNENAYRSLVIHDKEDQLVDWHESEQLASCWPNAELILTEGLGHRRILLDPFTVSTVVSFIDTAITCDPLDNKTDL